MKTTSRLKTSFAKRAWPGTQRAETHIPSAAPAFGPRQSCRTHSSRGTSYPPLTTRQSTELGWSSFTPIMTGYRVNVGEILAKELAAACANEKGILAFLCLISALCRRAAVSTGPGDKYTTEKSGWTRAVYMRKMDVADATPINVAMPTPPTSPIHMPAADTDEAGPSVQPSTPAEARRSPAASPPVVPVSSHTTTTSPTTAPAAMPASRETTPYSHLGSAPSSPPPPA
ncbi:hypothetical protein V6N13_032075 [Hibiscus sabdariffa]